MLEVAGDLCRAPAKFENPISCIMLNFLLKHTSQKILTPIAPHVKRSKNMANFTFSTLKVSLKGELCWFNHKNALVNIPNIFPWRKIGDSYERLGDWWPVFMKLQGNLWEFSDEASDKWKNNGTSEASKPLPLHSWLSLLAFFLPFSITQSEVSSYAKQVEILYQIEKSMLVK